MAAARSQLERLQLKNDEANSNIFLLMPRLHLLRSSYDLFVYDFPYDFFGIVGGYKLRRMCLYCLRSPYDFFGDKLGQTLQRPCGYRTTTARLSYNHRVIFTTSLYKSHDARTMTLRKSQGVGSLTVQLSCNYVHGFKRPSMFIFGYFIYLIFVIFHFYNSKSVTLIENIKVL